MRIVSLLFGFTLVFFSWFGHAAEAIEENINQGLKSIIPNVEITRIRSTPINNLYEVLIGPDVIYMTGDGRFVMKGDLLDLQKRLNLSEEQRSQARTEIFNALPSSEIIEFAPKNIDHVVYVFTDVDCSYCRRLHRDVSTLNENGVAIRYLAYPRAGVGSHAFNVMQSVWCANDRKQALTDAKNGNQIAVKQCPNPVEKQYLLGQKLGIRGTPAIFLEDGEEIPGYIPPDELLNFVRK